MDLVKTFFRRLESDNILLAPPPLVSTCGRCSAINLNDMFSPLGCQHLLNAWALIKCAERCSLCRLFLDDICQTNTTALSDLEIRQIYQDLLESKGTSPQAEISQRLRVVDGRVKVFIFDKARDILMSTDSKGLKIYRTDQTYDNGQNSLLHGGEGKTKCLIPLGIHIQRVPNLSTLSILANIWIDDCAKTHGLCNRKSNTRPSELPTRIMDIGVSENSPIRLVDTSEETTHYAAFSYHRGGSEFLKTTMTSIDQHYLNIAIENLPATFCDAIKVTRALGIRYLWIDALAIIQDDPEDWSREAQKMGEVYSNAFVTIAATCASDNSTGFLGARNFIDPTQITFDQDTCWIGPQHSFATDVDESCLASRAWVLQERVLSPRTLHFTDTQVYWECWTHHKGEDMDIMYNGAIKSELYPSLLAPGAENIVEKTPPQWLYLLSEYSTYHLKYQSDKLMAIEGLMNKISQRTGVKYQAGVWNDQLHSGLLWSAQAEPLVRFEEGPPSWSWAGWKGAINHLQLFDFQANERVMWHQSPLDGSVSLKCDMLTISPDVSFGDVENSTSSYPPELEYFPARFRAILDGDGDLCGWLTLDEEHGGDIDWTSFGWVLVARAINEEDDSDGGPFYCLLVERDTFICGYVRVGVAAIDRMMFIKEEIDRLII
jgi:hypothetical protein